MCVCVICVARVHARSCHTNVAYPLFRSHQMRLQACKYFSGIHFPKITLHVFVCDSENYMENLFGNYFLGKSHFNYTK